MAREIQSNNLAEVQKSSAWIVDFISIIVDPDVTDKKIYLSTHYEDITIGSITYKAAGEFLGFSSVSDDLDIKDNSLTVSLSGVGSLATSVVLDNNIEGSPVTVLRGYFNASTGALVADPDTRWKGFVNNFTIEDDNDLSDSDKISISVSCKSLLSTILGAEYGRFTSPASIGDDSMDFVASLQTSTFSFGKED